MACVVRIRIPNRNLNPIRNPNPNPILIGARPPPESHQSPSECGFPRKFTPREMPRELASSATSESDSESDSDSESEFRFRFRIRLVRPGIARHQPLLSSYQPRLSAAVDLCGATIYPCVQGRLGGAQSTPASTRPGDRRFLHPSAQAVGSHFGWIPCLPDHPLQQPAAGAQNPVCLVCQAQARLCDERGEAQRRAQGTRFKPAPECGFRPPGRRTKTDEDPLGGASATPCPRACPRA